MSMKDIESDSAFDSPGVRLARALRWQYPVHTAKRVAADFRVKPETARRWIALDARMPEGPILVAMFRKYGQRFASMIDPTAQWCRTLRLDADIESLTDTVRRIESELNALGGSKHDGS